MATKTKQNLFFHMDFFKDQKLITKHLYLLYTMTSGIFYESYVCQWFRYFTRIYFIIAVLFLEVSCSVIIFQYGIMNLSISILCATIIVSGSTTCFVVFNGYYRRKNFHKSLEIINEYSKSHENDDKEMEPEDGNSYTITNYNKYFKFMHDYAYPLILFLIVFFYIKFITVCLTLEASSDINHLYHYIHPVPFITHVDWLAYVLTYSMQTALLIPLAAINTISIWMQLLFSIIMRNEVILLRKEMRIECISITKSLDTFYEQETKILEAETCPKNKNHEFSNISKERELCHVRLANHTKKWIFRYQKLFTAMCLLKEYFEGISSINIMGETILCMSYGYISMMALDTKNVENFAAFTTFISCMFICCISSHFYDSMMDELENEIYGMPWYYLSSTDRKLILNFLSIVQRRCTMKVFKVYPITLSLYPNLVMKIYSYVQIIRVMEMKTKN